MANDYYQYKLAEGVIVPDTTSIVSDTQNEFKNVFGQDLSLEEATPQGRLIEEISLIKKFAIGINALFANQINPQYATGESLDALGALFNVYRKSSMSTTVWIDMVINQATTIPQGTEITDANGNVFFCINDVVIPSSGQYLLQFQAKESGAIVVNIGDITTPSQALIDLGVESATNNSAGIAGSDSESDIDYSVRIEAERYTGKSLVGDIESAIDELDSVVCSKVYNNGENTSQPAESGSSVNVDPHSVLVLVFGGNDNDIADVLINNISAGCGYTALENQSITQAVGYGANNTSAFNEVTFNRPESVEIYANIVVQAGNYVGANLALDIKNYLVNWSVGANVEVATVDIGQDVSPFSLATAIQSYLKCYVSSIQIGTSSGSLGYSEIPIDVNQIPHFTAANINISIQS